MTKIKNNINGLMKPNKPPAMNMIPKITMKTIDCPLSILKDDIMKPPTNTVTTALNIIHTMNLESEYPFCMQIKPNTLS